MIAFIMGLSFAYYWKPILMLSDWLIWLIALLLYSLSPRIMRFSVLVVLFFFFAVFWYQGSWQNGLSDFYDQRISMEGQIFAEIDQRIDHQKITVKLEKIILEEIEYVVDDLVLIKVPLYPGYLYGDKLSINGILLKPTKIEDFDYGEYLARYNIYGVMYNAKIFKKENKSPNYIFTFIFYVKNYFLGLINRLLPEPHASFLAGILLGSRKGIAENLMEAFSRTGVTHIIAVSGYNITLIVTVLVALSRRLLLRRKQGIVFAMVGILLFTILTGASAAVVRAAVMGLVVLFAQYWGRNSKMFNVLLLTAFIMLLINPKILMIDVGFQLSYLATLGLVYLSPLLEKYFQFLPEKFALRESVVTTSAAIIITSPLILYVFGRFSVVALLVNIFILPAIPIAMALGFLAISVGALNLILGRYLAYLAWISLQYIIIVVNWGSAWNWAVLEVKDFSIVYLLVSYLLLFIVLFKGNYKKYQNEKNN